VVPRVGIAAPSGPNSVPTAGAREVIEVPAEVLFRRTGRCTDDASSRPAELVSVPPLSTRTRHSLVNEAWTLRRAPVAP
jgi:hypothetical protein